jgi:protein SCO1/2
MSRVQRLLWTLGLAAGVAVAQPLAPQPVPPDAGLQPALDAQLPLDLPFTDSEGRPLTLREAFGDGPVLLVLGYYRCPQLCGLLMHGLLEALQQGGLPRERYRVLRVSIDPQETPADARVRRAADLAYAHFLEGAQPAPQPLDLRLLTGPAASVQALARAVGFRYQRSAARDNEGADFAHPAVAVVLTPEGRVSRYLEGVRFDPWALRLALVQADEGRVGSLADLAGQVALLCAHVDPRLGRHSAAVLHGVQALGVLLVLALAALWWRQSVRKGAP